MVVSKLPAVLQHPRGSLSVERALKNVLEVLKNADVSTTHEDRLDAAIDDVESMLERGFE